MDPKETAEKEELVGARAAEELNLTLILSSVLGFCVVFYVLVAHARRLLGTSGFCTGSARRVLLVTAHPDDETMFFGPTVVRLVRQNKEVMLLCLSSGDHRKRGSERKGELYRACKVLGIKEENVTVLKYTRLPDDPSVRWREELVSEVVLHSAAANDVDAIVTFDRGGVSGHRNHSSLHGAVTLLCLERRLPSKTRVFCLRSVNLLRKYSLVLDMPLSFLIEPIAYVASLGDWWRIQRAMAQHSSQYVWFRKLYMAFSRYVLINTYDELQIPDTVSRASSRLSVGGHHRHHHGDGGRRINRRL